MSQSYETKGRIVFIGQTEQVGENFSKRTFAIHTEEQYPQLLGLEFVKDKTNALDSYKIGDQVKVEFNLKGREWQGKYFTNLQAWRISKLEAGINQATGQAAAPQPANFEVIEVDAEPADDDLPF